MEKVRLIHSKCQLQPTTKAGQRNQFSALVSGSGYCADVETDTSPPELALSSAKSDLPSD